MNRPIFVIGSPRSGTSIVTWCLGQHSNILVQEESNWLGRFSLDVAAAYALGTHRHERSQLSALGVKREVFFATLGQTINELILGHRQELMRAAHERSLIAADRSEQHAEFQVERASSDPKRRWVDGTPEYSFHICGLRKLFPQALFIHLVREPRAVVRSILHFAAVSERSLAENEEQAYDYWLRTVRACTRAEDAYGPRVVRRVFHADLVAQPEATIRSILEFLDEPYETVCLEPLRQRINSSQPPADFNAANSTNDAVVTKAALELADQLFNDPQPVAPSTKTAAEVEADFQKQVHHTQNVNAYHAHARTRIAKLEKELHELAERPSRKRGTLWKWMRKSIGK